MIQEEEVNLSASKKKLNIKLVPITALVVKQKQIDQSDINNDQDSSHHTVSNHANHHVSSLSASEDVVMKCLLAPVKEEKPDLTCDEIDDEAGQLSESHPLFYHNWGKPFGCHSCGYSASRLARLKDHIIRIHTQEKPFTCLSCDYKGRTRQDLTNHKISHSGKKPYACYICDYRAGRSQQLKRHIRQHADDKMYDCAFCNYRADQPGILKTHLRRHTGEKPFTCNYAACGYAAARPDRLKDHILRTHTMEKPYSCQTCDYKSSTRKDLSRHSLVHTGEKPFACTTCNYIASRKEQLKRHMKMHTKEKNTAVSKLREGLNHK